MRRGRACARCFPPSCRPQLKVAPGAACGLPCLPRPAFGVFRWLSAHVLRRARSEHLLRQEWLLVLVVSGPDLCSPVRAATRWSACRRDGGAGLGCVASERQRRLYLTVSFAESIHEHPQSDCPQPGSNCPGFLARFIHI
jgi:hypothetical protein